jgi:ubiquinone/menaquinone biosynthesis C-methylase UbiE
MQTQDQIFKEEGNEWFKRNKEAINNHPRNRITDYVNQVGLKPKKILDIGCSNGYLLNALTKITGAEGHGIEPGKNAIKDGETEFPNLKFKEGFSHDLSEYQDNSFDLVVTSFILHWVDRSKLLQTVAEIDRVLSEKGHLIIQDFDPTYPCRTKYHHLPTEEVYTYKQQYWNIFTSSFLYNEIFLQEFLHDKNDEFINRNFCKLVVLQKRKQLNYPEL